MCNAALPTGGVFGFTELLAFDVALKAKSCLSGVTEVF